MELREQLSGEEFCIRDDVEATLHLYRRTGPDFLQQLNGMYAGAIFDPVRRRVLLFRDRFGIKPLYYTSTDEGFFFSSEIRPLFLGSGLRPELSTDVLPVYFSYRYVPGENTMFRGVRRLPPGSFLVMDIGSCCCRIERYWEYLPGPEGVTVLPEEAEEMFAELATELDLPPSVSCSVTMLLDPHFQPFSPISVLDCRIPGQY